MTPISRSASQRGTTLFELLVALALVGLASLLTAGAVRKSSPHLAIDGAATQLVADLKRARLQSESAGPIAVEFFGAGYAIPALKIARDWPKGATARLNGAPEGALYFGDGYRLSRDRVDIAKGRANAVVTVDPVTRRVSVIAP